MLLQLERCAAGVEAIQSDEDASFQQTQRNNRNSQRNLQRTQALAWICSLLIVVGILWRVSGLDQYPGVNGDEAWYGVQSQRFLDEYIYGKALPVEERVDFRTPTGNIWNPFLMIPRILLDATIAPSVFSLRLPALISGLLVLPVNWWLCRRALNRNTAWLTTALLAVLPVMLIYSRLGWDSCQSVLVCLPLVYLPWFTKSQTIGVMRTVLYLTIALVAAVLVHPTNIFLLPLIAMLCWPRISAAIQLDLSLRSRVLTALVTCCIALYLGIARGAWTGVEFGNVSSALTQWAGDIVGLLNGATVYGSISLPAAELPSAKSWLLLLSLPTLAMLVASRFTGKTPIFSAQVSDSAQRYAALFDGTLLSLLCFLGVAGPTAIQPGYERYGLWMIVPIALLIVLAYLHWPHKSSARRTAMLGLAVLQLTLLLAGYWYYYQQRFGLPAAEQRLAHWTYRTDNYADWTELRQEFEQSIENEHDNQRKIILIDAADPQRWWFEWKWRYLSNGSDYSWQILTDIEDSSRTISNGAHRWILRSNPESANVKFTIQYLAD